MKLKFIALTYALLMAVLSGCATAPLQTTKPPILIADPQHTINKGMGINSGFLYPTNVLVK